MTPQVTNGENACKNMNKSLASARMADRSFLYTPDRQTEPVEEFQSWGRFYWARCIRSMQVPNVVRVVTVGWLETRVNCGQTAGQVCLPFLTHRLGEAQKHCIRSDGHINCPQNK